MLTHSIIRFPPHELISVCVCVAMLYLVVFPVWLPVLVTVGQQLALKACRCATCLIVHVPLNRWNLSDIVGSAATS
jgi:hypothetical protein